MSHSNKSKSERIKSEEKWGWLHTSNGLPTRVEKASEHLVFVEVDSEVGVVDHGLQLLEGVQSHCVRLQLARFVRLTHVWVVLGLEPANIWGHILQYTHTRTHIPPTRQLELLYSTENPVILQLRYVKLGKFLRTEKKAFALDSNGHLNECDLKKYFRT